MQTAFAPFIAIIAAYLLGSISFAIVAAKLFGLADPRSYGSGNPGATNVLRSGNKKAALFTLIGDALKGWVAVFVAQKWASATTSSASSPSPCSSATFSRFFSNSKVAKASLLRRACCWRLTRWSASRSWALGYLSSTRRAIRHWPPFAGRRAGPHLHHFHNGSNGQTLVISVISLALIIKHWQNLQRLLAGQESKIGSKKK